MDSLKFGKNSHILLGYATAPKLSDKCHEISGILAGLTRPLSRELKAKDMECRAELLMWVKIFESSNITSKLLDALQRLQVAKTEDIDALLRETNKIKLFMDVSVKQPMLPGLIKALKRTWEVRKECRDYAIMFIEPKSVQFTLGSGPMLIPTLFCQAKLTEAASLAMPYAGSSLKGYVKDAKADTRHKTSNASRTPFRGQRTKEFQRDSNRSNNRREFTRYNNSSSNNNNNYHHHHHHHNNNNNKKDSKNVREGQYKRSNSKWTPRHASKNYQWSKAGPSRKQE